MIRPAPRSHLLARLLTVSAVALTACENSADTIQTGEQQTPGSQAAGGAGQGGSGQAGTGQSGSSGQSGAGVGGQAGSSGSSGHAGVAGHAGCAGQAPTCEQKCSDAWPPATCAAGQWVCPKESEGPDCYSLGVGGAGSAGGAAGAGAAAGEAGSAGAGAAAGEAGAGGTTGKAGAGGSAPLADCWGNIYDCGASRCYPRGTEEVCLPPDSDLLDDALGCHNNLDSSEYGLYLDPSDPLQCCYGIACPGGRPLWVEGSLTHATTARRDDWG